jgi:hypothetical protein
MIEPCRKSGFTLNIAERSLVEESHPQKIASCLPVIRSEPQQYQQGRGKGGMLLSPTASLPKIGGGHSRQPILHQN